MDLLKKLACLFILLIGTLTYSAQAQSTETIVLTGGQAFLNSPYGNWLNAIYKEAFHRLGYEFQLKPYPSQRAIVLGDSGVVDGQIERGHDFNIAHPDLVRVEEPTNSEAYSAWAMKKGLSLNGWDALKGTSLRVIARQGVGKTKEALATIVQPNNLHFVEHVEQALMLLNLGRADLYIDYAPLVEEKLKDIKTTSPSIIASLYKVGDMEITTHHAFLHKKHKDLAPKLASVLKAMKVEGSFQEYKSQFNLF